MTVNKDICKSTKKKNQIESMKVFSVWTLVLEYD